MVRAQALPPARLLALRGFAAHQLARMLHSLVRVSRRADGKPSASIARTQFPKQSLVRPLLPRASGGRVAGAVPLRSSPPGHSMLTSARRIQPAVRAGVSPGRTRVVTQRHNTTLIWAAFPSSPTLRKRLVERLGAR